MSTYFPLILTLKEKDKNFSDESHYILPQGQFEYSKANGWMSPATARCPSITSSYSASSSSHHHHNIMMIIIIGHINCRQMHRIIDNITFIYSEFHLNISDEAKNEFKTNSDDRFICEKDERCGGLLTSS